MKRDIEYRVEDFMVVVDGDDQLLEDVCRELANTSSRLILKALSSEPKSCGEIASQLGLTVQDVNQRLDRLEKIGLVCGSESSDGGRGRPPRVYSISRYALLLFPVGVGPKKGLFSAIKRSARRLFLERVLTSLLASATAFLSSVYLFVPQTPKNSPIYPLASNSGLGYTGTALISSMVVSLIVYAVVWKTTGKFTW
ncbi:hypothetical protein B9Q03_03660 [Candidatus Marsarchaeota G2 archaeon OSP_D]|uniref:HTH arsR-type domain-containing protein n=7 Tax=Candidatus Marsarchaeota group 2 TaxID=2203771 RepID=A0A2R6C6Z0_9ARCH|nr:MAG: hypothetical protein B9Q08_03745 [Candidatus Marsarchaeota G2 archaeon ECH_B_SAG-M15]PSN91631.1 MAG: hypothetical protein B9Q03_03660 [Candidatus Marsarchaeota G2 archaeon OSP_D]PSN96426.1 MAG: hypothetical protein B9Q06_01990 [Candidatus Marsarchaeota G2 archaeon ECH_B_2]PSO01094.1 MAG: hypothetical protein B9Q07_01330 [Candidatus Marsarchaeota G2 archaeon ECH_B_3]PSO03020.1 MAG: hypothetical protein B9Q05_02930 [Candidatus Marsarchaeota G2 archaeon ECH_B_1]PSO06675.1 MAG: hypothetica